MACVCVSCKILMVAARCERCLICGIITHASARRSIALSDGGSNVPVSRVKGGGQDGKSFSNQSGIKMFVCQVCLFEQGDWTLHWPSGMIRPTLICFTDPHMQEKKKSLSHHPMSSLDWAAVSIERETRPPWPAP